MEGLEEEIKEAARKFVNDNFKFPTSDMDYLVIENAMMIAAGMVLEKQLAKMRPKPFDRQPRGASM